MAGVDGKEDDAGEKTYKEAVVPNNDDGNGETEKTDENENPKENSEAIDKDIHSFPPLSDAIDKKSADEIYKEKGKAKEEVSENGEPSEQNVSIPNLAGYEKKALVDLRSRLETDKVDVSLWGIPLLPSKGDPRTDVLLFKFLKSRDSRPGEALEMLRATLEWRRENKIDSILDEEDLGARHGYDSVAFVRGSDREGHPICYNVYGVFADEDMYNRTFGNDEGRERFLRWRMQLLERQIAKLDFRPGGVSTVLMINDMKNAPGPSRRDLRLATNKALGIFEDNYPEFVFQNIFINVPLWYYAFSTLLSPFLMQTTKSKFVYSRPAKVTDTLLKYIAASEIPVVYGGLRRENDPEFSVEDAASEVVVRAGAIGHVEIPAPEVGNTLMWDLTIVGWDVNYKEEFVPTDEGSYTVIVRKGREMSWQQEPIRNTFKNKEPGKVVITVDNGIFKKKRVLYRYKSIPSST